MKTRLATMCCVAMFVIGLTSTFVQAQHTNPDAATLKGINALYVLVEGLQPGARVLGLTEETIQADVELKLRLAGMRVVTHSEGFKLPGSPCLYVHVSLTDSASAAHIEVDLVQNARLERNRQFAPHVKTWTAGGVISSPTSSTLRDHVKDLVDEFLNDWLSVNPKK